MPRYARQRILIGDTQQNRLSKAKVTIIGMGALGTVSAELLLRAGVTNLTLIDRDIIELSNLQRQTLYTEEDLEKSKVVAAKEHLLKIDSTANIKIESIHLNPSNIHLITNDLILDCTDNLSTRFLIDDFCRKSELPWIYAAAIKREGYVMFISKEGPYLRNFLTEANLETCASVGVLNTTTTMISSLQTTLAINFLTNKETPPSYLYHLNLETFEIKKLKITSKPIPDFKYLLPIKTKTIQFCGTGRFQITGNPKDFNVLKQSLKGSTTNQHALRWKNVTLFKDGRALIKAKNEAEAQSLYSKFLGN